MFKEPPNTTPPKASIKSEATSSQDALAERIKAAQKKHNMPDNFVSIPEKHHIESEKQRKVSKPKKSHGVRKQPNKTLQSIFGGLSPKVVNKQNLEIEKGLGDLRHRLNNIENKRHFSPDIYERAARLEEERKKAEIKAKKAKIEADKMLAIAKAEREAKERAERKRKAQGKAQIDPLRSAHDSLSEKLDAIEQRKIAARRNFTKENNPQFSSRIKLPETRLSLFPKKKTLTHEQRKAAIMNTVYKALGVPPPHSTGNEEKVGPTKPKKDLGLKI